MAKTAHRRSDVKRLQKKWAKIVGACFSDMPPSCLSFGRIFSKDPLDCGRPQCLLCSRDKNLSPKKRRSTNRISEREAHQEIMEDL